MIGSETGQCHHPGGNALLLQNLVHAVERSGSAKRNKRCQLAMQGTDQADRGRAGFHVRLHMNNELRRFFRDEFHRDGRAAENLGARALRLF